MYTTEKVHDFYSFFSRTSLMDSKLSACVYFESCYQFFCLLEHGPAARSPTFSRVQPFQFPHPLLEVRILRLCTEQRLPSDSRRHALGAVECELFLSLLLCLSSLGVLPRFVLCHKGESFLRQNTPFSASCCLEIR